MNSGQMLLNKKAAAIAMGISIRTLEKLIKSGELKCVRIFSRLLIDPKDISEFIEQQKLRS